MKNWFEKFLDALASPGGNLLILVFFDLTLLVLMGEPWWHYSDDADKTISQTFAGFVGATLQALVVHGGRAKMPEPENKIGPETPALPSSTRGAA